MAKLNFRKAVSDWLSVVGRTFTTLIGFCILIMVGGAIWAFKVDSYEGLSITAVGLGLTSVILGLISVGLHVESYKKSKLWRTWSLLRRPQLKLKRVTWK